MEPTSTVKDHLNRRPLDRCASSTTMVATGDGVVGAARDPSMRWLTTQYDVARTQRLNMEGLVRDGEVGSVFNGHSGG